MLNLLDKVNKMQPLEGGLFTFILGILVTFFGIIIIVICVSIVGKILKITTENVSKTKKEEIKPAKDESQVITANDDEVPEHIKVAIIAAISAYYENTAEKCDFVVRKIRRF